MEIILFNGYVGDTDNLRSLNRLIKYKECEVCKDGEWKRERGCWDCKQSTPIKCEFIFAGIMEITAKCE